MKKEKSKLTIGQYLAVGMSVFAMHFGGSSMIWPMNWGKESGVDVLKTFSGVFITSLFFVFLAYLALSNTNTTMYQMLQKVSPKFAKIYIIPTIFVIGPLFTIPRMSAASWDAIVQVFKISESSIVPMLIFTILYYIATYWFISDREGVIDKISKTLVPILILIVVLVVGKGLISPVGTKVAPQFDGSAFAYGFTGGYETAEVIVALILGGLILNDLRSKGIAEEKLNKNLLIVCSLGIGLLTFTHLGHMLVGANASSVYPDLSYSALYSAVVVDLWGQVGGAAFNIVLLFAALTTAVGLSSATADLTEEVSEGRFSYKQISILILVVSTVVALIGLDNIVTIISPLMDILYPSAITMVLFFALYPSTMENPVTRSAYKISMVATLIWGVFEGIIIYGEMLSVNVTQLKSIKNMVPGENLGMGYLSLVMLILLFSWLRNKLSTNAE